MDLPTRAAACCAALVLALHVRPATADLPAEASQPVPVVAPSVAASILDPGAEVVLRALSLLGVDYRYGGNTPDTGLDCSGLVRLVFHDALGLPLPRRSEEISRVGGTIQRTDLQPGDLVFFNTLRRAFSHVGIYIGNGQFVHAPSTGGSIRVDRLDRDYWVRRFDGARRLLTAELTGAASFASLAGGGAARGGLVAASAREEPAPRAAGARDERTPRAAKASPTTRTASRPVPAARPPARAADPRVQAPPGVPAPVAVAGPPNAVSSLYLH
jgi:hypothetical protein